MELKLLIVSDSHECYDTLSTIIERSDPDIILHAGDFCNIPWETIEENKHTEEARESIQRQIDILARKGKPIYIIPGNHDPPAFFKHQQSKYGNFDIHSAKTLGLESECIAPGLHIAALGGSLPGFIGERLHWKGYPYKTEEECDSAITNYLAPQLAGDGQYIILTHVGPSFSPTVRFYQSSGEIIEAGSSKLEDLLIDNYSKLLINIHGHTHWGEGVFSFGDNMKKIMNPGAVLYGKYAEILLKCENSIWKVQEIQLKQI